MKKFLVLSPINFNGKLFAVDSTIELDDQETVTALQAAGAIPADATENKPPVPEGEAKLVAIKTAINGMDKDNKEFFAKDGTTPKVDAISAVTGWPVTAAERDAALALAA